jgi:predicted ATP-binding protein involved in virulence
MSIIKKIKPDNPPVFKKIKMVCDEPISERLKDISVINEYFNKQNTTVIVGKPGSGKTSILMNFVKIYKECFDHIYVFMRESSRSSIEDNIFDKKLKEDQLFEDLTLENIEDVYGRVKEHTKNNEYSWVIFDDVQDSLKDIKIVRVLNKLVANQRHLRLVNFFLIQNFYALDKKIRRLTNNLFLFNAGKDQLKNIFDDYIEIKQDLFEKICEETFQKEHSWMFVNLNTQTFYNDLFEKFHF